MEGKKRYVWLKMPEGRFSNSWDESEHMLDPFSEEQLEVAKQNGCLLIEYACTNSPDFEFYDKMKLR